MCNTNRWKRCEDAVLIDAVSEIGMGNWNIIASRVGGKTARSCRLRWYNQLDPSVRHEEFTEGERLVIARSHAQIGNRWCEIATLLPGRTDNQVKNQFNSRMKRGRCNLDPVPVSAFEQLAAQLQVKTHICSDFR